MWGQEKCQLIPRIVKNFFRQSMGIEYGQWKKRLRDRLAGDVREP